MDQEAPDELRGLQRHRLLLIMVLVVSPAEAHSALLDRAQTVTAIHG
jgi:hypothetical protein